MNDAEIPRQWSQLATDIMVSKYFRKAGVPQTDSDGNPLRDPNGNIVTGPEKSAKQVIHRLAGCWRYWGEKYGYFDTAEDAQAFYDELAYMMLHQMCAPNSPQWFNTGLNFAYGITGPSQGHYYCDPRTGELLKSKDAYSHPQPHACFIQSVSTTWSNEGGIMDLWVREARLFKYGSGTGSNFSALRGETKNSPAAANPPASCPSSRSATAPPAPSSPAAPPAAPPRWSASTSTTPTSNSSSTGKVREELKVAAMAEGIKVLPKDQQEQAKKLGLKLDYDFNGEAYYTVSGQNSNNSIRIPNKFFKGRRGRRRLAPHLPHPAARSPRPSRPATSGNRSPSPPGAAPTPASSTTTRSTSGTPAPSPDASTPPTPASPATPASSPPAASGVASTR
jgi:ribonucleoside-diphosphate reductase alpha chain